MMKEVRNDLTKDAESLGLTLTDVRIRRTDLTKEVSQQTFDRMKAERLAEAEAIRARGNEGAQRRTAIADRGRIEILAAASKDAQILRGEGEAERNRIFGEAFNSDPEFYAFYRSMAAYQQSIGKGDATLVLSPNSEFCQYFTSEDPKSVVERNDTAAPASAEVPASADVPAGNEVPAETEAAPVQQ